MPKGQRKTKPVQVKQEEGVEKAKVEKKQRRAKPGSRTPKQITELQKPKKHPIALAAFRRLVKAVVSDLIDHLKLNGGADIPDDFEPKLSKKAGIALRERIEEKMVDDFRRAYALTLHTKRVTTYEKDYLLAIELKDNGAFRH